MTLHFDLTEAERAAYDVCYWIRDNRESFKALMAVAHRQVDLGNPHTGRDDVVSYARDMGMGVTVVKGLRRDHNLFAGLSRYMVMLRPRLARTLHFKESKLDSVDLVSVWHEVVNPTTTFLAQSWEEAKKMVELDDAAAA